MTTDLTEPREWLSTADFLLRMPRITTRQGLEALRRKGMPHRKKPKGHEYPWPAAGEWYLAEIERSARGEAPPDFEDARARKMQADADLAELELAKARGEVVPIEDVTTEVGRVFDSVRATALSAPGKFAPRVLGATDMASAAAVLSDMVNEMLEAMSGDDGDG